MRFVGRSAPGPLATTADEVLQLGDAQLPVKAEELLGAKYRLTSRKSVKRRPQQEERLKYVPSGDQKSLGNPLRAQETPLDTQEALLYNMPSNNQGGPSLWPKATTSNQSMNDFFHSGQQSNSRRPGIPPRRTSVRAVDQYYDSTRQPLHVSQQTSASAVRDMALRKGSPMIHENASEPVLARRPLKSAMKKGPAPKDSPDGLIRPSSSRTQSGEKKSRKLDLSHFFPQPWANSNRNLLSPNKLSRSPSTMTDTSEFFPKETVQVHLKRPSAHGRFETYKNVKPAPIESESTHRPKVFEKDIFDSAKTNVRRPPKGIQNWFDGFDISSDEEADLPELPADDVSPTGEAPPSVFSPWLKPENEQPVFDRMGSIDPVEDNLLAIERARDRMQERMRAAEQRKGSVDSEAISYVSSEAPGKRRGGESRMANSRLASESILSLSESGGSSDDEPVRLPTIRGSVGDESIAVYDAAPIDVQRPRGPARKMSSKISIPRESYARHSASTVQTSGSIPIRLTGSVPLPDLNTLPSPPNRQASTKEIDATAQALRRLNGIRDSAEQATRSVRTTHAAPAQEDEESGTVETSSNSGPNDGAHFMAVTEEEMILLEMMRNKRAAMQKNSFAEGYQLALTREQEHLARRRESAQKTAHEILRNRQQKQAQGGRESRIESVAEEALDPLDQQRRKYSAIRKEDVDKALKLERFLASTETPIEDAFPEPPVRGPIEEPRRPPQVFELLLPNTYSPTSSKAVDEPVSPGADYSPIPEDDDIEDHHHRVRQFLASSSASESASLFPTPPSTLRKRSNSRRDKRRSIISPSPVEEEEPIPDFPERILSHPSPPPSDHKKQRRRSINGRRLSGHTDIDELIESVSSTLPLPIAPLKTTSKSHTTTPSPYHLAPNFDFTPLDFSLSTVGEGGSPSLSTSHASPLTPTFTPYPTTTSTTDEKTSSSTAGLEIASSDNASLRDRDHHHHYRRAYTPDTDLTSLSASASLRQQPYTATNGYGNGSAGKKQKKPAVASTTTSTKQKKLPPPNLQPIPGSGIASSQCRNSITSMTSAGEDVLAAWAELGVVLKSGFGGKFSAHIYGLLGIFPGIFDIIPDYSRSPMDIMTETLSSIMQQTQSLALPFIMKTHVNNGPSWLPDFSDGPNKQGDTGPHWILNDCVPYAIIKTLYVPSRSEEPVVELIEGSKLRIRGCPLDQVINISEQLQYKTHTTYDAQALRDLLDPCEEFLGSKSVAGSQYSEAERFLAPHLL